MDINNIKVVDPLDNVELIEFPNGLKLYYLHSSNIAHSYVRFIFGGGSSKDKEGYAGTAHFLEHLTAPQEELRGKKLEWLLNRYNALTKNSRITYLFDSILSEKNLLKLFSVYYNRFFSLTKDYFLSRLEEEKKTIMQEVDEEGDSFHVFMETFKLNEFLGEELRSYDTLGRFCHIAAIDEEILWDYYHRWFNTDNLSMIVMGAISKDSLLETLEKTGFLSNGHRGERVVSMSSVPDCSYREFTAHVQRDNGREKFIQKRIFTFPLSFYPRYWSALQVIGFLLRDICLQELREERRMFYNVEVKPNFSSTHLSLQINLNSSNMEILDEANVLLNEILDDLPVFLENNFDRMKSIYFLAIAFRDTSLHDYLQRLMIFVEEQFVFAPLNIHAEYLKKLEMNDLLEIASYIKSDKGINFYIRHDLD